MSIITRSPMLTLSPQVPNEGDEPSPRSPSKPFPPGHPSNEDSTVPNSPPPSFRSRASSRRNSGSQEHQGNEDRDRVLDDAFAAPSDDESANEDEDEEAASSRRLVRADNRRPSGNNRNDSTSTSRNMDRRVTEINMFMPGASEAQSTGRVYGGGQGTRDGVFANISAKPTPGEDLEEKPPVRFVIPGVPDVVFDS